MGQFPYVELVEATAVAVQPQGRESRWNLDGELLADNHISAQVQGPMHPAFVCLLWHQSRKMQVGQEPGASMHSAGVYHPLTACCTPSLPVCDQLATDGFEVMGLALSCQ